MQLLSLSHKPNRVRRDPSRSRGRNVALVAVAEETLIEDPRARMTPCQCVEQKLRQLVNGGWLPVSHFRFSRLPQVRSHC